MNIFIAGATGAVGRTLIPLLTAAGHDVTGTTRSREKARALEALGAHPAIVHQMTALAGANFGRSFDKTFATTNRLRTEGTEHLLEAAGRAGVERVITQSFAGWPSVRAGGPVNGEDVPLDPDPPKGIRETHAAIRRAEELTTAAGGIALRYGGFYGPGTGMAPGGEQVEMLRKRRFPVVGSGNGVWSFAHVDDVATGTLAALEHGRPGEIYNIVDDDPAPVREWLPAIAAAAGAPKPRHVPAWVVRLLTSPASVMMMTSSRGASNAKAKRELGWEPVWPTWREGVAALFATTAAGSAAARPARDHANSSS
jgi:nucleoside-diphosphate-sugar epimerase